MFRETTGSGIRVQYDPKPPGTTTSGTAENRSLAEILYLSVDGGRVRGRPAAPSDTG